MQSVSNCRPGVCRLVLIASCSFPSHCSIQASVRRSSDTEDDCAEQQGLSYSHDDADYREPSHRGGQLSKKLALTAAVVTRQTQQRHSGHRSAASVGAAAAAQPRQQQQQQGGKPSRSKEQPSRRGRLSTIYRQSSSSNSSAAAAAATESYDQAEPALGHAPAAAGLSSRSGAAAVAQEAGKAPALQPGRRRTAAADAAGGLTLAKTEAGVQRNGKRMKQQSDQRLLRTLVSFVQQVLTMSKRLPAPGCVGLMHTVLTDGFQQHYCCVHSWSLDVLAVQAWADWVR